MNSDTPLSRFRTILQLGLPITGGMLSQSLINLADTAMVGRLGEDALAAIGTANYAIFVCFAMISGLSVAVQSRVARRFGAGDKHQLLEPVGGGLRATLWLGIPLSLILYLLTPVIIGLFRLEPSVSVLAENYFCIRILSLPAAMLMLTFRGFWNGCHHPWHYLKILVIIHVLNIAFSYTLIFGVGPVPAYGLSGAATGTVMAMYCGAMANVAVLAFFALRRNITGNRESQSLLMPLYRRPGQTPLSKPCLPWELPYCSG